MLEVLTVRRLKKTILSEGLGCVQAAHFGGCCTDNITRHNMPFWAPTKRLFLASQTSPFRGRPTFAQANV